MPLTAPVLPTDCKTHITLSNFTASGSLTASTSIDIGSVIAIPQTTSGVTLALPTPALTSCSRPLRIVNTGTVPFIAKTSTVIFPGHYADFHWSVAAQTWIASTNEAMAYNYYSAYKAGDKVLIGNIVAYANGDIAASTSFNWGLTGATWSPIIPNDNVTTATWAGVYAPSTTYPVGSVFVTAAAINFLFYRVTTAFTSSTNGFAADIQTAGSSYLNYVDLQNMGFTRFISSGSTLIGATSSTAGRAGVCPQPASGKNTSFLRGDATWSTTTEDSRGNLTTTGGVAAGPSSPAVMYKKYSISTSATLGAQVTTVHGLTASKIVSCTGMCSSGAGYIPPAYLNTSYQYGLYCDASNIVFQPGSSASGLQSQTCVVIIGYTA